MAEKTDALRIDGTECKLLSDAETTLKTHNNQPKPYKLYSLY
jgi:hypothetical protein